jgi:hypothetical protein
LPGFPSGKIPVILLCSADCCSGFISGSPAITGKTLFIWAGGDRVTILKLPSLQINVYLPALLELFKIGFDERTDNKEKIG